MPTKKPAQLPESLRYLQAFANALAKLPPEELNEDVDPSRLEAAMRKRLRGLDEAAAEVELEKDRALLTQWLEDKPDHPAHWIRGFLLSDDLAVHLVRPPEPPPRGPEISFDAPGGWKVKKVPFRLDLKAGKVVGSILASDQFGFEHMLQEREQTSKLQLPNQQPLTWSIQDVSVGEARGKKFVCVMSGPIPWKDVRYALRVPGGFVVILLGTMTGADFDESPLEAKFDTLRVSQSS